MSIKPSLRSLIIGINLVVLVLPVAGIQVMRLYESALVRQTESALIAQSAFVAAFYRAQITATGTQNWMEMSREFETDNPGYSRWRPQAPTLDLTSSTTYPPFPDAVTERTAEPFAAKAGEKLIPVLKDAQLTTLAGIRIVDPWGIIIASTGEDVGLSIAHTAEVESALQGRPMSRLRNKSEVVTVSALDSISRASRIRVFVANPIVMHERLVGAVVLSRTPPSIVQALYAKRWLLLQALALIIALVLLMSLLTYRLIARPITKLADRADLVAQGQWNNQELQTKLAANPPRTKEIARLQQAIANMSETLAQRTHYLQEFSRHISHEFKTPIASIQGAIEVLQDHAQTMSESQRDKFLANVAADAERLHRLTERLMELTQAEMQFQETTRMPVLDSVESACAGFAHQVQIDHSRVLSSHTCLGHREIIGAVLDTLLENAVKYGGENILLWSEQSDHELALFVQDDGQGISAGNAEKVFTPFFTTRRDQGGTGLGLTIAQTLINHIEGRLTLLPGNGPTTFKVTLRR